MQSKDYVIIVNLLTTKDKVAPRGYLKGTYDAATLRFEYNYKNIDSHLKLGEEEYLICYCQPLADEVIEFKESSEHLARCKWSITSCRKDSN